jgi:hypothetical protein
MRRAPTRAIADGPFKTADPMTEAEYQAALAALDAQRAALEHAYTTSQTYPHWAYHATEPAHLVYSDAEALALGAGWSPTPVLPAPPVVTALVPDTAVLGSPDFTLTVEGTGFTATSVIVWNGADEPTTVVSATALTTGVHMATAAVPITLPVAVRNGDGPLSNAVLFTFTEAPAPESPSRRGRAA